MSELKFHPLADIFPLMEGEEFDALVADIKANRLRDSVLLYEGMILDGRNRYRALRTLGADPKEIRDHYCTTRACIDGHHGGPVAYVISANIHRRHLTAEQKRELIAKLIKAQPQKSDRQIAKQAKADHKTVGAIRKKKEATGEVSPVEKRVGKDGKARKLPATEKERPRRRTKLDRELDAGAFDRLRAEQARNEDLAEKLRAAEIKIVALEGEVEDLRRENAELRKRLAASEAVSS